MSSTGLEVEDVRVDTEQGSTKRWKHIAMIAGGTVIVLVLLAVIVVAIIHTVDDDESTDIGSSSTITNIPESELQRIDCYPEAQGGVEIANEENCLNRGCVWEPSDFEGVPPCYVPQGGGAGGEFGFRNVSPPVETTLGYQWELEPMNEFAIYESNFERISFEIEFRKDYLLRFKFDVPGERRFKVDDMIPLNLGSGRALNPVYEVDVYQSAPFAFRILRSSTGAKIWDTGVGGLAFTNQFLQIATRLPSENIYGFGENLHDQFRHDMNFRTWPLWARDEPSASSEETSYRNLYSVHPFYECVESDGNTHGVLLYNANAMDYTLTPLPMLVYKTIGGILDFYVFMGPTPETVVQQYTEVVGRPYMPPYWMLGFQLSRYGYHNLSMMRDAVDRTIAYDIPLDVIYADIDHMYKNRIFTVDPVNYADLQSYFTEVRERGSKTIIILDPCVEINDTYWIYPDGVEADIYVKWSDKESMPPGDYEEYNRTDMMGAVWPEWKVVFPDFLHSDMEALWTKWLIQFRNEQVPFDGLWLDMNEPANFDTNGWRPWNWPEDEVAVNWTLKCPNSTWDDPPYRTKASYVYDNPEEQKLERLSSKTLCMVGVHGNNSQYMHYDMHNLYAFFQTKSSVDSLRATMKNATDGNPDLRSMIVTRSTYPGSAKYAGRWLGDNASKWKDLRLSVIGMLEFNVMGFPYIGADICGFFDDCPPELCRRWQELGAFYPYSRNHNHEGARPQDPGYFGESVAIATRDVMRIRYTLLPFLYTLFHNAHVHGNTVVRPLFHEFIEDPATYGLEREFLWGPSLLIAPILEEESVSDTLELYLPRGRWYDYYTRSVEFEHSEGTDVIFNDVDLNTPIKLFIRGGYILPTQLYANNTAFSRQNAFGLIVALDSDNGEALGELFWDDGDSIDTYENGEYYFVYFTANDKMLSMEIQHNFNVTEIDDLEMGHIELMGVTSGNEDETLYVYVNGVSHADFTFDPQHKFLNITDLSLPMNSDFTIEYRDDPLASSGEAERQDCCPETGCDQTKCTSEPKNCLWSETQANAVPWCYIDNTNYGYSVSTTAGDGNYTLEWKAQSSIVGGDIHDVLVQTFTYQNIFRLKATDAVHDRYEVPFDLNLTPDESSGLFDIEVDDDPFAVKVKRSGTDYHLFDTSIGGFTMADQFIQVTTRVPTSNVYGFGEHVHPSLKHDFKQHRSWPIFARDEPPKADANLYSSHPFYLCVEEDGKAHGVLFWNSNSIEVTLLPAPAVSLRAIGGIMDIYIVIGDSPEQVIQRYTQMIGYSYLPPYWSLGFQISRYGYNTLENMQAAVDRTINASIPLDVVYMDIDTFDEYKSFTYDTVNFAGLPDYINEVHDNNMRAIVILDPFLISNETDYLPYDLGLERDVFIKWPPGLSPDYDIYGNDNLLGWAWPKGRVVFPDFFHINSTAYWEDLIVDHQRTIAFDGLWIDMNEPANFGTNEDRPWNWPEEDTPYWSLKCPNDTKWDAPPYKPVSQWGFWMCEKTICMTALQDEGRLRHYDVHNLYGHGHVIPTLSGLRKATPGRRGMVISRSTFPGTGAYGGRWLGDNAAIWPHLRDSIIGMIEFNWFGIPYVGADICGYFDSCPEDLCQRWHQLGAFYPFSRNHNGLDYDDQDPGMYSEAMQSSTRKVLNIRYRLLPYLYTLFYQAHTEGSTVVRPLFHEYPTDTKALSVDEQFLWGPALLISPVLKQYATEVLAYFPEDRWFDYYTGREVGEAGRRHVLSAPLDHIPLHVRGGYVLPLQQSSNTTHHSRMNPFELLVAPDVLNNAEGSLFWDDGESVDTVQNNAYCYISFVLTTNRLESSDEGPDCSLISGLVLEKVRVFGVESEPSSISTTPDSVGHSFTYDSDTKVLDITGLLLDMDSDFSIEWV